MVGILFVCTGNICRSPTAEGIFRAKLLSVGLANQVTVDSAATHDYHIGEPPDLRSVQAAAQRGIDIASFRARRVTVADFDRFDLLICMDKGHRAILDRMAPFGYGHRVRLFLDFAQGALRNQDVPDPYYGDADGFEMVLDLCETGSEGLLEEVKRRLGLG